MAEPLLVGRNFVSGICKLKHKNLKTYFLKTRFLPALGQPRLAAWSGAYFSQPQEIVLNSCEE